MGAVRRANQWLLASNGGEITSVGTGVDGTGAWVRVPPAYPGIFSEERLPPGLCLSSSV